MNCPLCTNQILEPHYRAGIEIDVCPHCRGVWLDRGELDKLVAGANPGPSAVAPQPQHLRSASDARDDWDDRDTRAWDDGHREYDIDRPKKKSGKKSDGKDYKSSKKRKKKKSWGELLGDVLEEVLD